MYTEDFDFIDYIIDYVIMFLLTFVIYALPVLICAGAVVAMVFYIKKKKEKRIFTCVVLSLAAVLCMSFWGWAVYKGAPYSREPIAENVELVATERNKALSRISDEDLNAAFETCIDYYKNSGKYEFSELTELRFIDMESNYDRDRVSILASVERGFFFHGGGGGGFRLERKAGSDKWEVTGTNVYGI